MDQDSNVHNKCNQTSSQVTLSLPLEQGTTEHSGKHSWSRRTIITTGVSGALAISSFAPDLTMSFPMSFPTATHADPIGVAGLDLSGVDPQVRPQDDLYRHVNGKWLAHATIPPGQTEIDSFSELADRNVEHLHHIITGITATSGEQHMIKAFYTSIMDTGALEATGLKILYPLWHMVDHAHTKDDLVEVVGKLCRDYFYSFPMDFGITVDIHNSTRHVWSTTCGGLGLSRKYLVESRYDRERHHYQEFLRTIYQYAGFLHPDDLARRISEFERTIAGYIWPEDQLSDISKTYNVYSLQSLQHIVPAFPLTRFIAGEQMNSTDLSRIIVDMPSYYTSFSRLWDRTDIAFLRSWIKATILRAAIVFLPQRYRDASFKFYGTQLGGLQQRPPRWKAAVEMVDGYLGDALGKLYVQQYFPVAAKEQVHQLIENIKHIYRQRFQESWLSPATKTSAIIKLDAISTDKVGYPDRWENYQGLDIGSNFYQNMLNLLRWGNDQALRKFAQPVDKTAWGMTPPTVNAYYNAIENEIVFPAGILQPPFFSHTAAPAVNYGAIGAIIGHEISHAFDSHGAEYDAKGNIHNWWSANDKRHFQQLTRRLVDQFNGFVPTGLSARDHINGLRTVGENAADLNGLTVSLDALRAHYNQGNIHGTVNNTIMQAAFFSWARIYRKKMITQELQFQVAFDQHSPNEARVNQIVKNIDAFYTAFQVHPGDKEYLSPQQRIRIW